jgi:hypothetical protein
VRRHPENIKGVALSEKMSYIEVRFDQGLQTQVLVLTGFSHIGESSNWQDNRLWICESGFESLFPSHANSRQETDGCLCFSAFRTRPSSIEWPEPAARARGAPRLRSITARAIQRLRVITRHIGGIFT